MTLLAWIGAFTIGLSTHQHPRRRRRNVASFLAGAIIGVQGFSIGIATGFLGVGGGFLIVPALVLLVGLPARNGRTVSMSAAAGAWV